MRTFKKCVCLALCACLCLGGTVACRQPNDTQPEETDMYKKSLKILAIGNSFADDALWYGAQTAKSLGAENVTLGILYIGGCSVQQHAQNSQSNATAYTYRKTTTGVWSDKNDQTLLYGLTDEDWDFISIQQVGTLAYMESSYDESLDMLVEYVNEHKTNPQAKLVFHMTWAYQNGCENHDQMAMHTGITESVKNQILKNRSDVFDKIIPTGVAVQNIRTSYIGDDIYRDGVHLDMKLGRAVVAATYIGAITGWSLDNLSFIPVGYKSELPLVIESAKNAIANPFTITQSAFTQAS